MACVHPAATLAVLRLFLGPDLCGARGTDGLGPWGRGACSRHKGGPQPWALGPPVEAAQNRFTVQALELCRSGFESQLCFQVLSPWETHLVCLSLRFLVCKMET